MDIGYILFVCIVLYIHYKFFMADVKKIDEKNPDNLNQIKPNKYNFETKENGSVKESEIMKCGWPAGIASLYDDEFMKDMEKSNKENKN